MRRIWKSVEPAMPDCIEQVEEGVFEARWWKPVPTLDIDIIRHARTIVVMGEPYEPEHLPAGIAVRFRLCNER